MTSAVVASFSGVLGRKRGRHGNRNVIFTPTIQIATTIFGGGSLAPVNVILPSISGPPQVGQTITTTQGAWTNSPLSYSYQWKSNAGGVIGGATMPTYIPSAADIGNTLTATVTAENGSGSTPATSAAVGPVTAAGSNPIMQLVLDMSIAFPITAIAA